MRGESEALCRAKSSSINGADENLMRTSSRVSPSQQISGGVNTHSRYPSGMESS